MHCWDAPEFLEVILWGIENLDEQWEFVDGSLPSDEFPTGIEFGFVLRRSGTPTDPVTRRRRFEAAWRSWDDARRLTGLDVTQRKLTWAYRRTRRVIGSRVPRKLLTKRPGAAS